MRLRFTRTLRLGISLMLALAAHSALAQSYSEQIQAALELRSAGAFAEAEALLRQTHETAADQRETFFLLSMTIAFQQRFEEAEAMLDEALERYPDDLTLRTAWARVQSFQSEYGLAQDAIARVLEADPGNIEALNLSGRLALYQNQPSRAVRRFEQVMDREPQNLEAAVGLHDAYRSLGDHVQAEQWLRAAVGIDPDNEDVRIRQDRQQQPEPHWQVTYGYGNSHFKRIPLGDWYDSFIEAHRFSGRGDDLYFRVEGQGHFGMSDTMLSLGTVRDTDQRMPWGLRLDLSPDAVFVPNYRISGFIAPRIREGGDRLGPTVLNLSAQYASYETAEVGQLGLSVDQYLFNGRLWLTPSTTLVVDENSEALGGWNLRANLLLNDALLIGAGYGESPQTEAATTANTRAAHLFSRLTLSDRADLRLDLVREDRENSYVRYGASLALTWKY